MGQQASEAANKAAAAASKIASEQQEAFAKTGDLSTPTKSHVNGSNGSHGAGPGTPTPLKSGSGFKAETATREELLDVLGKLHKKSKQIK